MSDERLQPCCYEPGCKRKKPIMIGHSELTGNWYVVTDYIPGKKSGQFTATRKHMLGPDQTRQLDRLLDIENLAHQMAMLLDELVIDGRTTAGKRRQKLLLRFHRLRLAKFKDPVDIAEGDRT